MCWACQKIVSTICMYSCTFLSLRPFKPLLWFATVKKRREKMFQFHILLDPFCGFHNKRLLGVQLRAEHLTLLIKMFLFFQCQNKSCFPPMRCTENQSMSFRDHHIMLRSKYQPQLLGDLKPCIVPDLIVEVGVVVFVYWMLWDQNVFLPFQLGHQLKQRIAFP